MNKKNPIITIRNLKKSYDEKELVLKGINLNIFRGEIIGYIGPNGAGKTTTVKILTGVLDKFSGDINVLGYNMSSKPIETKKRIGYIPENAALYDTLTPLEYLGFIGRLYEIEDSEIKYKAEEMLKIFELSNNKNQRMTKFSKGMKQKVLIISGIIHNPDIIFLDEPLQGLDINSAIVLKEILIRLAKMGKTIFYCSHIIDVVERICHRIIIINKGQILVDSTLQELQLMHKNSKLEDIFTRLTSSHEHGSLADQFISAMKKNDG